MREIVDEEGNLLGIVNVIDLFAVVLLISVLVGGVALVSGGTDTKNETPNRVTIQIEYQSQKLPPFIPDAISEGAVPGQDIHQIHNKSVRPSEVVTKSESGNLSVQSHPKLKTVTLTIGLNATLQNGEPVFRKKPVEIGRKLKLDLGNVTLSGFIVDIKSVQSQQ